MISQNNILASGLNMDFGEAKFTKSRHFNNQLLIVDSVNELGKVYKFHKKSTKVYACASCKSLGKSRTVTVVDGRLWGNKHPEDDHHPECTPVDRKSVDILEIDREMRSEVNTTM